MIISIYKIEEKIPSRDYCEKMIAEIEILKNISKAIILDVSKLTYINSYGISIFIELLTICHNFPLYFHKPQTQVLRTMDIMAILEKEDEFFLNAPLEVLMRDIETKVSN